MTDDRARHAPRSLPIVTESPQTIPTRYTPDVLAGIALGEAAALAPLVSRDAAGAMEAAAMATVRADELTAAAMNHEPPDRPIACRRGCSTCCQAKVLVVAPEILRIGDHLRKTRTPAEVDELLERIREADATTRGLTRAARAEAHVQCPLLDADGGCSIHQVRPLVCRSWTSYDALLCEAYWQEPRYKLTPPQWPIGYELSQAVLAGLGKACLDRGLDGVPLEFIAALRIVLERRNAGERWSKKLPVFLAARDEEWAEANRRK